MVLDIIMLNMIVKFYNSVIFYFISEEEVVKFWKFFEIFGKFLELV